jgi:uncharacterized protein (DUF427 family)
VGFNLRGLLAATGSQESANGGTRVMRATWKGATLAESDQTIVVEGNHYFPPASVRKEFLKSSPTHTSCPWKGQASYCSVGVNGETNRDAAWFYPDPNPAAAEIRDCVAFWRGVSVKPVPGVPPAPPGQGASDE